jgi:hypothetical protein
MNPRAGALSACVLVFALGCSRPEPVPPSLEAAELILPAFDSTRLSLVDGVGEARADDGTLLVEGGVTEWRAIGDFDADGSQDALVVAWSSGGGTGTFMDLVLFAERPSREASGGAPTAWLWQASEPLGDRVRVRALTVDRDLVEVRLTRHAPDDPMCCPTERAELHFRLMGGTLVPLPDGSPAEGAADGMDDPRPDSARGG